MLSVVIPAYNAEKTIGTLLTALKGQDGEDFETIVVDDGSHDRTVEIAKRFKVKVFANRHKGPAWQRNFGARMAKGDTIVFTDADCIPPKRWLREMTAPLKEKGVVGVSGTYRTLNPENMISRFEGYEIERRHRHMAEKKYTDFIGTAFAAYRRNVFLKAGGFDTSFPMASGEDTELSFRLARMGYKMVFNPNAWVFHPHTPTLRAYVKQKFWRAYWRVPLYKRHPKKVAGDSYTGLEIPLSAASMAVFVLSAFFALFSPAAFAFVITSLLFLYAINLKLFIFLARNEVAMVMLALLMLPLRTLIWMGGFVAGTLYPARQP